MGVGAAANAELTERRERIETAEGVEAWLMALRERVEEIEGDSPEAFAKRRELAKLLVERISVGRNEEGRPDVRITYRFGPSLEAASAGVEFVSAGRNGKL
jgi:hypothetical protein